VRIRLRWRRRARQADDLPPSSARQRLLVALAAIAITGVIGSAMLAPQLALLKHKWLAAQPKPCAAGESRGCVGGTMPLIVLPASAPGGG
jgi:hypothetical protein